MSKRSKIVLILLILCCALPEIFAFVFQKEIFPWSSFPMYSGVDSGRNLILLSAFVADSAGQETPIEKAILLRPKYEYRWRIPVDDVWARGLQQPEKKILHRFGEIFKDDLKEHLPEYNQVRFYLEFWKNFEGPRRFHPDERRLIFEYPLHP